MVCTKSVHCRLLRLHGLKSIKGQSIEFKTQEILQRSLERMESNIVDYGVVLSLHNEPEE